MTHTDRPHPSGAPRGSTTALADELDMWRGLCNDWASKCRSLEAENERLRRELALVQTIMGEARHGLPSGP